MQNTPKTGPTAGVWKLSPLLFFAAFYLTSSIVAQDFYATPIIVTFLLTLLYATFTLKGTIQDKVKVITEGAGEANIQLMICIFILAGAFSASAKYIGAIDATVNLALSLLPQNCLLAGMFLASCFLSLSMGTSVGTIAALTPIATGISDHTSVSLPFVVAIVVGGAYFGDNLSFISDTTIMATRTQGCRMKDKFRTNLRIVLPAALACVCIYLLHGKDLVTKMPSGQSDILLVLPYLLVLATAIMGVDVMLVLLLGIVSTLMVGMMQSGFTFFEWMNSMSSGALNMGELIIVTLMAGGLMAILRKNGGLDYVVNHLFGKVHTRRKGETSIALTVFLANLCTANNTIAILAVGSIAKDIAAKCGIDARKAASLLDTFSCLAQSIIPYGAQLLIASSLAGIGTFQIIPHLYYPFLMALCAIGSIIIGYPKMKQ